jgi:hypothetical protein
MARRRIWRRKPEAEKERRRKMAREKQKVRRLEGQKFKDSPETKVSDMKQKPEVEARYLALSPMMKETVDNLVSRGLSMEKVINGLRS